MYLTSRIEAKNKKCRKEKNIMKKFLALLLAAIMLVSFAACNTKVDDNNDDAGNDDGFVKIDPPHSITFTTQVKATRQLVNTSRQH